MKPAILASALLFCIPAAAHAQQVVLTSSNIVGASSVFDSGAGDMAYAFVRGGARVTGAYGAGNIFNSQLAEPGVETWNSGQYFLTGDGYSYWTVANPYITIDLGAFYTLSGFTLYNTSNGAAADRGTADFTIMTADALADDGANGATLAGPTTVLATGTLAQHKQVTAPIAQSFTALSHAAVRYIQFRPTSATAEKLLTARSFGLNELKVFAGTPASAVPEPAGWSLMIAGFGLIGTGLRLRRSRARVDFA